MGVIKESHVKELFLNTGGVIDPKVGYDKSKAHTQVKNLLVNSA